MRNNHKLVLCFCFFKSGLSGTRFVQLLSIKHGSGFVNYDNVIKKHYVDSYKAHACLKLRVSRHVLNKGPLTKPAF